jgi:hypothetical protein
MSAGADAGQGGEEQGFDLGGAAAVKRPLHGDPDVMGRLEHAAVQAEPLFHFPLDVIALDRIADLAVNGNGEAAGRPAVLQKVQKKKSFLIFGAVFSSRTNSVSFLIRWDSPRVKAMGQAVSFFLPFLLLLLMTARPPLVSMRARKPCVFFLFRLLG